MAGLGTMDDSIAFQLFQCWFHRRQGHRRVDCRAVRRPKHCPDEATEVRAGFVFVVKTANFREGKSFLKIVFVSSNNVYIERFLHPPLKPLQKGF